MGFNLLPKNIIRLTYLISNVTDIISDDLNLIALPSKYMFFIKYSLQFSFFPFYCCSSTVVSFFSLPLPLLPSNPHTPTSHPQSYATLALSHVPWQPFLFFPCYPPPPSPLVTVSLSFFQCLWLYFACSFLSAA